MRKTFLTKALAGVLVAATVVGGFFAVGGNVTVTKAATVNKAVVEAAVSGNYQVRDANYNMYVKQDLNARKGPGTSYKVVTTLKKGTKVAVTGEAFREDQRLNWAQVKYNGKNVYVSDKYLSTKKAAATTTKKYNNKLTVKKASGTKYATQAVYMRAGAAKTYKVVTTLKANQKVTVVGECYRGTTQAGWTKVAANGKTGYVATSFLKNSATKKTTKTTTQNKTYTVKKATATMYTNCDANFRKAPSAKAALKSIIKKGAKVKVNGVVYINNVKSNWYKITVNGTTGYMFNGNLEF